MPRRPFLRFFRSTFVLAAASTLGCGAGDGADFSQLGETKSPIIAGTPLSDEAARNSGVVVLEYPSGSPNCSGTLLDSRWVSTANHCIAFGIGAAAVDVDGDQEMDNPGLVTVRFGNLGDPTAVRIAAQRVFRHPLGYWGLPGGVDAALIYLSQPAPALNLPAGHFSNGRRLVYPGLDQTLLGKVHTLIGYGMNIPGEDDLSPPTFGTLRFSNTRTVSSATPTILNFDQPGAPGSVNHGDSGGPAFYDISANGSLAARFLTGIASTTSTHTGVQGFRPWMSERVWGKLKPTILAHSGFASPANLFDGDVNTAAVDNDSTASVDLDLGGTFQLTEVRVAEDNRAPAMVGAYAVQCWNGSGWGAVLFNDSQTNTSIPFFDEHPIANGCTTSRVRVLLSNGAGPVEVYELELYGTPVGTRTITVGRPSNTACTTSPPAGAYTVPVGSDFHVCGNDCGSDMVESWTVTGNQRTTTPGDQDSQVRTCIDVREIGYSGSVTPNFQPFIGMTALSNGHGTITHEGSPDPHFLTVVGRGTSFEFQPDPEYRVKEVCPSSRSTCIPWSNSSYVLDPVTLQDFAFSVSFELANAIVKRSGKCLDARGGSMATGTPIQQSTCNGSFGQWFEAAGTRGLTNYSLRHPYPPGTPDSPDNPIMCLVAAGGAKTNGTKIVLEPCRGEPGQYFRFESVGGGYYRVRDPNSNRCLDVTGNSTSNGASIQLWDCGSGDNQKWRLPHPVL